jgi:hypothetical protein
VTRWRSLVDSFLFREETPHALALCRIAVFGSCLWVMANDAPVDFARLPAALWQPTSFFAALGLSPIGPDPMRALVGAYAALLALATVGLATRATAPAAALLGLYVLGYTNEFGKIHHSTTLPALLALVLAFSRCGDALALDCWRKDRDPEPSPEYGWPLQLGRLAFGLFMFSAGLSKLLQGWIPPDPEQFTYLFARSQALAEAKDLVLPGLTLWLARHGALAPALGVGALAFELGAPIAVIAKGRVRLVLVAGLLGMQLVNAVVLGIHTDLPWLAGYAFFVPWDAALALSDIARVRLGGQPKNRARLPISPVIARATALAIVQRSGAGPVALGEDEALAVCVVRDAEETIEAFLDHHLALGVRQIVLLDNGSRDATPALAARRPQVTVLSTGLPFGTHAKNLRAHLRSRFGSGGGWLLQLDADELFDYPHSQQGLPRLLRYLNTIGADAMVANMLEMFARGPLREPEGAGAPLRERYAYYDLAALRAEPLPKHYRCENPALRELSGGIRERVFPSESDKLHKVPLVRIGSDFGLLETRLHRAAGNPLIADVSGVLYHYQFTATLLERSRRAVRERSHGHGSRKYRAFLDRLESNPDLSLYDEAERPQRFTGTDALISGGFLHTSARYEAWAREPTRGAAEAAR